MGASLNQIFVPAWRMGLELWCFFYSSHNTLLFCKGGKVEGESPPLWLLCKIAIIQPSDYMPPRCIML